MTLTLPTPLLHDIDPAVLLVPDGRRVHECRLDTVALTWNEHRIRYDAITAVAYATRARALNLVQRQVERRVRLRTATGSFELVLGSRPFGANHGATQHAAYRSVLATLHATVEPRLRAQLLRRMAAGAEVTVGPLRLTSSRIENLATGERVDWRQLPSAQLGRGVVSVSAAIEREAAALATIDMLLPNAPLLPELLDEATITFA